MCNRRPVVKLPPASKYPQPPPGFIPFQWKTAFRQAGISVQTCPNCGAPEKPGDKWGFVWGPSNCYTDPEAQRLSDEARRNGLIFRGAGDPIVTYEGVPLLQHPSRYSPGQCCICGCELWQDFRGNRFYKPRPVIGRDTQLALI